MASSPVTVPLAEVVPDQPDAPKDVTMATDPDDGDVSDGDLDDSTPALKSKLAELEMNSINGPPSASDEPDSTTVAVVNGDCSNDLNDDAVKKRKMPEQDSQSEDLSSDEDNSSATKKPKLDIDDPSEGEPGTEGEEQVTQSSDQSECSDDKYPSEPDNTANGLETEVTLNKEQDTEEEAGDEEEDEEKNIETKEDTDSDPLPDLKNSEVKTPPSIETNEDEVLATEQKEETVLNLTSKPAETSPVSVKVTSDTADFELSSLDKPVQSDTKVSENKGNSDSDKENIVDGPMDLTLASKPAASSEVIMLSDEEAEQAKTMVNGFTEHLEPPVEKVKARRRLVKRLQDDLRNEEAKLVLLKKIRQSQLLQTVQDTSTPSTNKTPQPPSTTTRQPQAGPPPLVKGNQPVSSHKQQHYSGSNQPPQLTRVLPNHHNPTRNLSRSSQSKGPPPLVMAPTARGLGQPQSSSQNRHQSSNSHHVQTSSRSGAQQVAGSQVPQPPQQPEQTPAQRQAAAKLALRKQLEKTLLQIPPPKPPPPEMNFIPSLAGNDFMLLVGLEEVVKFIVDIDARAKGEKGPEVKYVFNPFVCVQCGTDFTPVWKRDKPGSKNVICEQCVTSNQKKALKQEHTNRLKSAFVKALQQEQEIEQRMQAQTSATSNSSSAATSSSTHHSTRERERDRDRDRDRDRERDRNRESDRDRDHHREESSHSSSRSLHSHSQHASSSHSSHHGSSSSSSTTATPVNLSTNFKPTNEQIRQHQNLIQAHQAQLRGAALAGFPPSFNPRLMYPFSPQHLPGSSNNKADLQRQYLLDMIPRSLPGGSVLWRT